MASLAPSPGHSLALSHFQMRSEQQESMHDLCVHRPQWVLLLMHRVSVSGCASVEG